MDLSSFIKKCERESSSSQLQRSSERQDELGEVFTPTYIVLDILEKLSDNMWEDGKTYLDPTCGNGQFLAAVAIIKLDLGHTSVLDSIYGVDLMQDNVEECRERLLAIAGDTDANRAIVNKNILCKDGLTYDYSFGQVSLVRKHPKKKRKKKQVVTKKSFGGLSSDAQFKGLFG